MVSIVTCNSDSKDPAFRFECLIKDFDLKHTGKVLVVGLIRSRKDEVGGVVDSWKGLVNSWERVVDGCVVARVL